MDAERPRNAFQLLGSARFGAFFWGRLTSTTGIWLHSLVAVIVVYDATASALAVGLVTCAQFLPQLALGPRSGVWVDRGDPIAQVVLGRVLVAAGAAIVATWLWCAPGDWEDATATVVVIASLVVGLGIVVGGPALQSLAPELVRPSEVRLALALNAAPMTVGRSVGPAVGALVTTQAGAPTAFVIAVLGQAWCVVMINIVRRSGFAKPAVAEDHDGRFGTAVRHVRSNRPVLLLLCCVGVLAFGSEPMTTLAPSLAHELGGGTPLIGGLTSSVGLGAGLGFLTATAWAQRVRHEVVVPIGLLATASCLGVCALAESKAVALVSFGVSGWGFIVAITSATTLIQTGVPAELRGRIMALWLIAFAGVRPFAAIGVGVVADVSSVHAAFAGAGALLLLALVACRPQKLALDRGVDRREASNDK